MTDRSPELVSCHPGEEGPVTVSVSRRVRPGREREYEDWVHGIAEAASVFPGHQGVNVLRPSAKTAGCYVLIYRYDSWETCRNWEDSLVRNQWMAQLEDLGIVEGEAKLHRVTGLEFWFDLPEVPVASKPSPHKMALVLIVVVFALVYPMQLTVGALLSGFPLWAKVITITIIQVCLMTYIVMPQVTRALKGWIFK